MSKKIAALFLAGAFVTMPAVCFAETVDNAPLPPGDPATVHEAQIQGVEPAVIAIITGAIIITIVAINASSSNGTH